MASAIRCTFLVAFLFWGSCCAFTPKETTTTTQDIGDLQGLIQGLQGQMAELQKTNAENQKLIADQGKEIDELMACPKDNQIRTTVGCRLPCEDGSHCCVRTLAKDARGMVATDASRCEHY